VIIDEVHHADAPSYRYLLAGLEPVFLLGINADGPIVGRSLEAAVSAADDSH
jgi:hypothetical protein